MACAAIVLAAFVAGALRADDAEVKEKAFDAPNSVKLKVRMEGPYAADVPLQVVCHFKNTAEGAKRMSGAPVELDKRLGGVIASLRERDEFVGDEMETLLIIPPKDTIKAQALLLIGLGPEEELSLKVMERVGKVALREAARLDAKRVAFAPLIRDQGNAKLAVGDVEIAVVKAMLLAYDTDKRMQREGLSKPYTLEEWNVEAGAEYFDDTVTGAQKAIKDTTTALKERTKDPYRQKK